MSKTALINAVKDVSAEVDATQADKQFTETSQQSIKKGCRSRQAKPRASKEICRGSGCAWRCAVWKATILQTTGGDDD